MAEIGYESVVIVWKMLFFLRLWEPGGRGAFPVRECLRLVQAGKGLRVFSPMCWAACNAFTSWLIYKLYSGLIFSF
jgi:hypothetical protein